MALIEVGNSLSFFVEYVHATKCKNCSQEYAYEERGKPDIEELSTESLYAVTITRYWRCKYCGYIDSSKGPENVKAYKGKLEKAKEISCVICGLTKLNHECRYPDIKVEKLPGETITTTLRYYRCKYCGYVNIEVEKETETQVDTLLTYKSKGKDPRLKSEV